MKHRNVKPNKPKNLKCVNFPGFYVCWFFKTSFIFARYLKTPVSFLITG